MTINVLVVDDSALIREVLSRSLEQDGDIKVVGTAADPIEAREKIKTLNPDVLTLDIEMPNMNGLAFLDKIMRLRPMPVVMVSTLTQKGAEETMLALELGAVDFVAKPGHDLPGGIEGFGKLVRTKVRAAGASDVRARSSSSPASAAAPAISSLAAPLGTVIALGASTGGVEAIRQVLSMMPADCPPVLIAQHMPAGFTERFAARLNDAGPVRVCEAGERMEIKPGRAYVAPGGKHLRLERSSGVLKCRLSEDELISGHRPSVTALFESVAKAVGSSAVGVILTGMGKDGAQGLKAMRDAGAHTIGQSESSALVYGMPKVAFELGAVVEQVPVEAVVLRISRALERLRKAA